ncbi:hypothetical protein HMPREF0101_03889 [Bacteroides fragilis]|nr:hypothetical protein HMPREF0101_03889 [Bacteroides fragilis]
MSSKGVLSVSYHPPGSNGSIFLAEKKAPYQPSNRKEIRRKIRP